VTASTDDFAALYRAHAPSVFRRAKRLLRSEADAHDVVSDVFISLYERPEQYSGRCALSTFLYSMTTHACFNRIRSGTRRAQLLSEARSPVAFGSVPTAPDRVAQLCDQLARMPEQLAHVAVYHYLDELSQEEIAEILDCTRSHVRSLLARLGEWTRTQQEYA